MAILGEGSSFVGFITVLGNQRQPLRAAALNDDAALAIARVTTSYE
ncbi:MAG: hypothetical protein JNL29_12365 [Nitrospira sp.]|nr:hypothetical protein [Nitrospira sp.]